VGNYYDGWSSLTLPRSGVDAPARKQAGQNFIRNSFGNKPTPAVTASLLLDDQMLLVLGWGNKKIFFFFFLE
jgi:hypothetical protein